MKSMKNMKNMKLITLVSAVLIFASCSKDSENSVQSGEISIADVIKEVSKIDVSDHNMITLSASNIGGETAQIDVHQDFDNSSETARFHGGDVQIAINGEIVKGNYSTPFSRSSQRSLSSSPFEFGKKITFQIQSSSAVNGRINSEEYEVYNPELIRITNKDEIHTFDKTKGLPIQWNADLLNEHPVTIELVLRSESEDGSLTSSSVNVTKIVYDTGDFTVPASDLAVFPNGSTIDIVIIRGNQERMDQNAFTLYNSDLISAKVL